MAICCHKTAGKQHLKQRIQAIHRGIEYPCKHCGYTAINLCQVRNHVLVYHNSIWSCTFIHRERVLVTMCFIWKCTINIKCFITSFPHTRQVQTLAKWSLRYIPKDFIRLEIQITRVYLGIYFNHILFYFLQL